MQQGADCAIEYAAPQVNVKTIGNSPSGLFQLVALAIAGAPARCGCRKARKAGAARGGGPPVAAGGGAANRSARQRSSSAFRADTTSGASLQSP